MISYGTLWMHARGRGKLLCHVFARRSYRTGRCQGGLMRGTCDSFNQQLTTYVIYIYLCIYAHLYTRRLTHMSYVYIYIDTIKLCKALVPFPFFE